MSTETSVNETANAGVKKLRRGVNNATRATVRKKFDEKTDMNVSNGLFIAHLDSITVRYIDPKDDGGLAQFIGLKVPTIDFVYASNEKNENDRKYYTQNFMVVPSNVDTIPGGSNAWRVDNIFRWFKHIYDVFVLKGTREMTEEEENLLSLDFEDFDEEGNFVQVEPEVIVKSYDKVFTNFMNLMNNNGKPYYGVDKPIWIKLLRFVKQKGEWKAIVGSNPSDSRYGDLALPTFVGEGCLELYSASKAPTIKVDVIKESPRWQNAPVKQPNLGTPTANNPVPPVAPMSNMGTPIAPAPFDAGINPAAPQNVPASDLPF